MPYFVPTAHKSKAFILSSSQSKINALNFNCLIYLRFSGLIMIWFQDAQDFKFGMPIVNDEYTSLETFREIIFY
jgi:hypothetical protein